MMRRIILSVSAVFLLTQAAFAEMQIYLFSTAQMTGEELRVKDIAFVDGTEEESGPVKEIALSDVMLRDTYIDRRELSLLLRKHDIKDFSIYGTAVKIVPAAEQLAAQSPAIRSGDKVKVIVIRKNIKLELSGSALKDAEIGAKVVVRCGDKKISGIVKDSKTVTCEI